jgi:Family of unknown function (DUF5681)
MLRADGALRKPPGRARGRRFEKGRSGNPAGRRPRCRNNVSLAAEALLDGEAEALIRKAVELAFSGDPTETSDFERPCRRLKPPVRQNGGKLKGEFFLLICWFFLLIC